MTLVAYTNTSKLSSHPVSLSTRLLTQGTEIITDMTNIVVSERHESEQTYIREDLRKTLKEVCEHSGGDFQTMALAVVQYRQARLENATHFIDLS